MAEDYHHESHYSFGTKNFVYDPKKIEAYTLEELLKPSLFLFMALSYIKSH